MVAIELTNTCNLKCEKCPRSETKRPIGFLDGTLFDKILEDIRASGVPTEVALSGSGEPTLHKQLVEFVRKARGVPNVGVVGFATNAVNLTPDLSELLLDAGLTRLKISLDTDDRETFRQLNGVDAYPRVVENLARFCELNKKKGEPCSVTMKVTLYTSDSDIARNLKHEWSGRLREVRATKLHNWAGLLGARDGAVRTTCCKALWRHIQICWDGQITLCCFDSLQAAFNMGNARDIDLVAYWRHDPALYKVRRLHEACDFSTLPVCAECNEDQYSDISLEE